MNAIVVTSRHVADLHVARRAAHVHGCILTDTTPLHPATDYVAGFLVIGWPADLDTFCSWLRGTSAPPLTYTRIYDSEKQHA